MKKILISTLFLAVLAVFTSNVANTLKSAPAKSAKFDPWDPRPNPSGTPQA